MTFYLGEYSSVPGLYYKILQDNMLHIQQQLRKLVIENLQKILANALLAIHGDTNLHSCSEMTQRIKRC